jgi:phosphate transport system ATP-binding protein
MQQYSNMTKKEIKPQKAKITTKDLNLYYGKVHALKDINMEIPECAITAIIGPSGCGKTSLLRQFNRGNDLFPIARTEGQAYIDKDPIFGPEVDRVELTKRIGMVFQKPNVFPMSIYDNVIIGPKHHGIRNRAKLMEICERSLRQAALWDEVKDILGKNGQELSGGARQRLCIARCVATNPEVILFDESCSALDPESTLRVEQLMAELAEKYTIIIVTHNMEQAVRVSDMSAFMMIDLDDTSERKAGRLVEFRPTYDLFSNPIDKRTEDYITGRFG